MTHQPTADTAPVALSRSRRNSADPFTTHVIGVLLSAAFGLLVAVVGTFLWFWLFQTDAKWWFVPFILVSFTLAFAFYEGGTGTQIDVGFEGVGTFFGKRLPWLLFSEGKPWVLPWGMGGVEIADIRRGTSKVKEVQVLSKDGLLMTVQMIFERVVTDSYVYLSADDPDGSVFEIAQTVLREVFPEHTSSELITAEVKGTIAKEMKDRVDQHDFEYGLNVLKFLEPEILPPQTILDAMAKKLKEELEAEAEKTEIDAVRARIAELVAATFTPQEAYEIVQAERSKSTTTRNVQRFEGLEGPVAAVANLLLAALNKNQQPTAPSPKPRGKK